LELSCDLSLPTEAAEVAAEATLQRLELEAANSSAIKNASIATLTALIAFSAVSF
jgi:hypothetical protein